MIELNILETWLLVGLLFSFSGFIALIGFEEEFHTVDDWIKAYHMSWKWAGIFVFSISVVLFGVVEVYNNLSNIWRLMSLYAGIEIGFIIDHYYRFTKLKLNGGNPL